MLIASAGPSPEVGPCAEPWGLGGRSADHPVPTHLYAPWPVTEPTPQHLESTGQPRANIAAEVTRLCLWAQFQAPHAVAVCPQASYLASLSHGLLVFLLGK